MFIIWQEVNSFYYSWKIQLIFGMILIVMTGNCLDGMHHIFFANPLPTSPHTGISIYLSRKLTSYLKWFHYPILNCHLYIHRCDTVWIWIYPTAVIILMLLSLQSFTAENGFQWLLGSMNGCAIFVYSNFVVAFPLQASGNIVTSKNVYKRKIHTPLFNMLPF